MLYIIKMLSMLYILYAIYALLNLLEDTARYAGLLLAPAEGFGLRPRPVWPLAKAFMAFGQ